MKRNVIICVGNELRGDDGVALLFYERLEKDEEISKLADVVKVGDTVTLKPVEHAEKVIVVDAVDFGGEAGEVRVLNPDDIVETAGFTHKPGINIMMKAFGVKSLHIIGIQPKTLEVGKEVSEECARSYEKVRNMILALLSS